MLRAFGLDLYPWRVMVTLWSAEPTAGFNPLDSNYAFANAAIAPGSGNATDGIAVAAASKK